MQKIFFACCFCGAVFSNKLIQLLQLLIKTNAVGSSESYMMWETDWNLVCMSLTASSCGLKSNTHSSNSFILMLCFVQQWKISSRTCMLHMCKHNLMHLCFVFCVILFKLNRTEWSWCVDTYFLNVWFEWSRFISVQQGVLQWSGTF